MIETLVTIILIPFAFAAVIFTGALAVGLVKSFTNRKKN